MSGPLLISIRERQLEARLENKLQSQLDGAGTARAKHGVEGSGVWRGATTAEQNRLRRIGVGALTIGTGGAPGIGKLGVIENVKHLGAELRPGPFSEFEGLGNGEIHVVETGIAEDVPAHGTKLAESVRDQKRIAHHIAIARLVQGSQRVCPKVRGRADAGRGDGAGAGRIGSEAEARNSSGADGLEIGWITKEIPAVGGFVDSAKVIGLIIYIPWLSRLHGDDGIELPA